MSRNSWASIRPTSSPSLPGSTAISRTGEDYSTTEDYHTMGRAVRDYAVKNCGGRRFGVLEGGYNHAVLGKNVRAFVEGMA